MLDRAQPYGLLYSAFQRQHICDPQINRFDKLNNSRKGFAGYYRYKPRNILETYSAPPYKPSFRARCCGHVAGAVEAARPANGNPRRSPPEHVENRAAAAASHHA